MKNCEEKFWLWKTGTQNRKKKLRDKIFQKALFIYSFKS